MSRIGKLPIVIPENVAINSTNSEISITGKFGTLKMNLPQEINVIETNGTLSITLQEQTRKVRALQGLYRTLIYNMVVGVSEEFAIILLLKGVGYRAAVQGRELVLNLGYSHPVKMEIPETISVEVLQNTTINLKSCHKEKLGLFAAKIRAWRQPEPYKGKGILYENERIIRKAGKSAK
jgi:large subunit ribosomal protein L6